MESLNSLTNSNCFNILQDKLNDWTYEFQNNCTEINISKCCELLELNARIQTQLFKLLGFCGIYGGLSGSEVKLKKQLTPYLGKDYFENGLTSKIVMDILNDVSKQAKKPSFNSAISRKPRTQKNNCSKERIENDSADCYGSDIPISAPKNFQKVENQGLYDKLNELENILIDLSSESKKSSKKPSRLKKKPSLSRSNSVPRLTRGHNEGTNTDNTVPSDTPGDFSGSDVEEIRNDTYLQSLVGKYNDLFSEARVSAMDHLRLFNDDHENNQRILFALVMIAARCVVKLQRSYRTTYTCKPNQAFRETISRTALKNLRAQIIYELINNRGNYYRFHMPNDFSFSEMESLINRTIQLFWNFGGSKNELRLMEAADGEMFDEHKYRRSYDSDFNAPLVNHHIWPCLIQNHRVLVKGEACTRASNKLLCSSQTPIKNMFSPNRSKPSRMSETD